MIVLSPHLDDAVFSCGALIAGSGATVVTILAGIPDETTGPSWVDERAGFGSGADAVNARRAEDIAALAILGAKAVHLDCLDGCYATGQPIADAVSTVLEQLRPDEVVLGPLGLRHPDHELVAEVFCRQAREQGLHAWLYEELPYRVKWPEFTEPAIARAACTGGLSGRPCIPEKQAAIAEYRSQMVGTDIAPYLQPERYHRL